jgi:signal transduction histidine kinase
MLDNLLGWGKLQQGSIKPVKNKLLLNTLIDDIIDFFNATATMKDIGLINTVPPLTAVFSDENMLRSILRNLISNALKFTGKGGEVVISAAERHENLIISVKDTGIGIDPEKLEHLLKDKNILSTEGTLHEKGSGFGLLLCREYAKKLGGTINAESKANEGSVFSVALPIEG